jgi:hypothetical protein
MQPAVMAFKNLHFATISIILLLQLPFDETYLVEPLPRSTAKHVASMRYSRPRTCTAQQSFRPSKMPCRMQHMGAASSDGQGIEGHDGYTQFEAYYRSQGICNNEDDFRRFLAAMRTPAPITVRLNTDIQLWQQVMNTAEKFGPFSMSPLPWCTQVKDCKKICTGWRASTQATGHESSEEDGNVDGNDNAEEKDALGSFLEEQQNRGGLARQEFVSMLPPWILLGDSAESYDVLDLCASPGSKSTQMLNMMGRKALLVANEFDRRSKCTCVCIHVCFSLSVCMCVCVCVRARARARVCDFKACVFVI